jgi:CO dehydrogenase maturation factor
MKICVCGKGGSGKSTVVALIASEFTRRSKRVIVVDSDESNAGLYWMLGFDTPPVPLMELAGGKKNVQRTLRAGFLEDGTYKETPVLAREELRIEDLPPEYVRRTDSIEMVGIGKIHQALEGCACPMGVLSREFLRKLRTRDHEVVVVDMEAGVEHFGRGVETAIDAVLVVVEPSLESVSLAGRIKELAIDTGATFAGAVLNKVNGESMAAQLTDALRLRDIPVLATVPFREEFVQWALEGSPVTTAPVAQAIESLVDDLVDRIATLRGV